MPAVKIEKRTNEPEAIQWNGENAEEVYEFLAGVKLQMPKGVSLEFKRKKIKAGTWFLKGNGVPEYVLTDNEFNEKYKIIKN